MVEVIDSPAQATYWVFQGRVLFSIIPLLGIACFAYLMARETLNKFSDFHCYSG
jgi:hypothetical protein